MPSDTFKSCPKVLKINLSRNFLKTLPSNVFESNRILHSLNLSDNSFEEVNPLWLKYSADYLEKLDLSRNLLKVFPVNQFPELHHLKYLFLSENHLHDIDEDAIVKRFKILNKFEFSFNYIGCIRSEKLEAYFKARKIVTTSFKIYKGSKKARFQQNEKGCINDGEWSSLKLVDDNVEEKQNEVHVKKDIADCILYNFCNYLFSRWIPNLHHLETQSK